MLFNLLGIAEDPPAALYGLSKARRGWDRTEGRLFIFLFDSTRHKEKVLEKSIKTKNQTTHTKNTPKPHERLDKATRLPHNKHMEATSRLNVRIPDILRVKLDRYVEKRQEEFIRYCYNDAVVEALRRLVDEDSQEIRLVGELEYQVPKSPTTAAELAAIIPGVSLGMGTPGRKWLPELKKLKAKGEVDQTSADEDFKTMIPEFRPPKGWNSWTIEGRAKWLDEKHPI